MVYKFEKVGKIVSHFSVLVAGRLILISTQSATAQINPLAGQLTEDVYHNPVGLLSVDASLNDWQNLPPIGIDPRYALQPDDGLDLKNIFLAHNSHFLYVAYDSYLPITLSWAHNIFIDSDENVSTGLQYAGMGIDILVQQGRVYKYLGDGNSWEWLNLFTAIQATTSEIVELAIPRIVLGQKNQI